ncbi:DNA internalization-related competence protein ComEC/Rec2 [Halomonas elongata]|uniref:DNA internalization-related competence protein ComEC/Rec2 n=1 Tax=Halomonas elongata TaxID=2746 RepID=UPI0023AE70CA|nr:DNA internalization-related competence protein ComEC/Rec2 [Halomonas elongata]
MRQGWAIPLALATLAGVSMGAFATTALLQGLGAIGLWCLVWRRRRESLLVAVMMLVVVRVLLVAGGELAPGLSRQDVRLDARVLDVSRQAGVARLDLSVDACRPLAAGLPPCDHLSRARLSVYQGPDIQAGERWRLTARLRPPSGFANPGTFDYRGWLWREGIQATGYLRQSPAARRLSEADASVRGLALTHLDAQALAPRAARWLAALTLGAERRLETSDWELLNASGTTHLVVISGLHIGLVATFALGMSRLLARGLAPGRWRMAIWPWWLAGMTATGYAVLAGLEAPALRALVMTLVGLWVASGRHAPGTWQAWWLALALVLLLDPLSAWRPGLWLSFLAVALLILIWQGRARPRGVRGWCLALVRTQWLLAPVMAAAVLLAFGRLAPAAPLVNLVAVPLVSGLMVPLGLAGWLLAWVPALSMACWSLFAVLTRGLAATLETAVTILPLWQPAPEQRWPLAIGLGLVGALWALPGLDRCWRVVGTLLLAIGGVGLSVAEPARGTLWARVYDVGQGQLVELRTADYRVLVDTGPRFGSGFMPLETLWAPGQAFDEVIVSHGDQDHAGGLAALDAEHIVDRYLAPSGEALPITADPCRAGRTWERDGVEFRFLWPPPGAEGLSDNDRSCVLLATAGAHRLLIPGDVGRRVERSFMGDLAGSVTVLVAGHHGSRTSSGPYLVRRLMPEAVIFSAARDSRFGHPASEVVRRFRNAGTCLWSTAHDGALTLTLGGRDDPHIVTERPLSWRSGGVGRGCLALESPATLPGLPAPPSTEAETP